MLAITPRKPVRSMYASLYKADLSSPALNCPSSFETVLADRGLWMGCIFSQCIAPGNTDQNAATCHRTDRFASFQYTVIAAILFAERDPYSCFRHLIRGRSS